MLLDRLKLDGLNKDDVDDRINVDIDGFPTLFGRINEVKDEDERFAFSVATCTEAEVLLEPVGFADIDVFQSFDTRRFEKGGSEVVCRS